MKRRLFDASLFSEAMRQLRLIGLSGGVVLFLEAILLPIGRYISLRRAASYGVQVYPQTVGGLELHPLLVLCFAVLAPLMMLVLFQFLNKRAACDFYHAIPCRRVCLFVSFFAAVMAWLTVIAAGSTLVAALCHALLGGYFTLNIPAILIYLFNMLAGCLYVCGAVAIAMCLTGTLFTNVTVSLLLLFMPRLLLAVFCSTLENLLPVVSALHFIPPLDSQYNVVTNLLFGLFSGNAALSFTFWEGGVYTLCLGAAYTALAAWLFHRRKSETAGKAAPNRAVQTVYRLLIAMLICLIPCVLIVSCLLGEETLTGEELFAYFVLYLGAVIVYCLYELCTTRKWRNVLRSLPALGILLVMNLAFIGGVTAAYYSTLSIQPAAEDIESVRLIDNSSNEYYSTQTAAVRHDSPVIRQIVAERLQYTLELVRESPQRYYIAQGDPSTYVQQVAVYLPGRTIYRNILLTGQDLREMAQELEQDETYRDAYLRLPEHPSVSVSRLNDGQTAALYDTLREEVASLPFSSWYSYLKGLDRYGEVGTEADSYTRSFLSADIQLSGTNGAESYQTDIPLGSLLPRTSNQYMAFVSENGGGQVLEKLESGDWSESDSLQVTGLHLTDQEGRPCLIDRYFYGDMLTLLKELLAEFAGEVRAQAQESPDIGRPMYLIVYSNGMGEEFRLYVRAGSAAAPEFLIPYE